MNSKQIKQWMPRVLVVATLAATGVVIAAEQEQADDERSGHVDKHAAGPDG